VDLFAKTVDIVANIVDLFTAVLLNPPAYRPGILSNPKG